MFFKNLHHGRIAFSRCMHMPEWYGEFYKLIDEPRGVEHSFFLRHRDDIIILRVFFSKLCHEVLVVDDGLVHVVETTVARHRDRAFYVEVEVKIVISAVNVYGHADIALLDFALFERLKPGITEVA